MRWATCSICWQRCARPQGGGGHEPGLAVGGQDLLLNVEFASFQETRCRLKSCATGATDASIDAARALNATRSTRFDAHDVGRWRSAPAPLPLGESKRPTHHSNPPYDGGEPPSSAYVSLSAESHATAASAALLWQRRCAAPHAGGACAHATMRLPHVMRRLLWSSPVATRCFWQAAVD